MASIIVVDNFYGNPDQIRQEVLASRFDFTGRFPGRRTAPFQSEQLRGVIEAIVKKPVAGGGIDNFRTQFQLTTTGDKSWIHYDESTNYAGVLYLTPGAPPGSGTSFFRHLQTGRDRYPGTDEVNFMKEGGDEANWEETDRIGNKYNRLVLYDSKMFHRSSAYFGNSPQDGRLFQVFFFNIAT
jgi:hypothetical protein